MITYRTVTTIQSVTLHVSRTHGPVIDILGPPCPISHLYPLNFVPSAAAPNTRLLVSCSVFLPSDASSARATPARRECRPDPSCSLHHSNARLLLLLRLHSATTTTNALQRLRRWPLLKLGKVKLQMLDLLRRRVVSSSCHVLARQYEPRFGGVSGENCDR